MKRVCVGIVLAGLCLGACQTTSGSRPVVQAASAQEKQATIDRVKSLKGTWNIVEADGKVQGQTIFSVGGGGTVREVMFAGGEHEMTNMYHMDGQAIVCTHYCAMGNQPRMKCDSSSVSGDSIRFTLDKVSNLRKPDESCMREMVLTFKDPNTIEQRWISFKGDQKTEEVVFTLKRVV
ncbi:MAG: hypothetical protein JSS51_05360 [Planctomycetes bacterium]|nr:hypothetical protein [Planctomycetota bacterium]